MKPKYLIKQTYHGGEHPPSYFCGGYVVRELANINPDWCYKSLKTAQRVADKYNGNGWSFRYCKHEPIEVPESAFMKGGENS